MSRDQPSATSARAERDRVADALRARIDSGELRPGDSLPTQQALMDEFEVERGVVRKALALLKSEHRLAGVGRGSPPTVAEQRLADAEAPRPAGVELADRIKLAFQATDVTLDVLNLTTETLTQALAPTIMPIATGEQRAPASITARVLVPSPDAHLAIPRLTSESADDDRPLQRLHELVELHARSLHHTLRNLRERNLVPQVSVEVRGVPLTPTSKLYVLNGTEALMGYYRVLPRQVEYRNEMMAIYDVLGLNAPLFHYSAGPESRDEYDAAFVEQSQLWFESLWTSIAVPYPIYY
ncbi:GntR family transcriptional regulator [Streptomyces sp. CMB-StM0423]|uniref:GntR family transcriptional regulator n=1 Tax=Streptomyces sp. CMB-StM0423 TaxID=2059884 RepID=UPI000C711118|nr:GntR family transcriptional regulator [Streptomyces sp. CMB-StM0423]AUH42307.1 GntR family transcriptional regulator [Streptomyces sp. CMB-StM0423]